MSIQKFGWVPPEKRSLEVAKSFEDFHALQDVFGDVAKPIEDSGKGKIVLLHKALEEVCGGEFPVHLQGIGDCVGHGYGGAVDTVGAVQIKLRGSGEIWKGETSTEWIYGASRVLQGRGRLGNEDGSLGVWAQQAVKDHGTLLRQKHGDIDLTRYDARIAKEFGYRNFPRHLEVIADEHPIQTTAIVRSYSEARDAIANGYPVVVCSNQGFTDRRDELGFALPKGNWGHCMYFIAVDDDHGRPGLLCVNSWGTDWISGPKRHGQPEGSFWVDADVCDVMLRQQDSYALSNFKGFESQNLDPTLWEIA